MTPLAICLAACVLGVDYGYRPLPEGGVEYLIQFPPHSVESLKAGASIASDLPREVKGIRAFRILVGTQKLPRELPAAADAGVPGPLLLPPEHTGRPIAARRTTFVEPEALKTHDAALKVEAKTAAETPPAANEAAAVEPPKSWTLLTLVLLLLFASLGGNVYLGWIAWDAYKRYRALLRQSASPAAG